MTKKRSSEILGVKMEFFSGKNRHSEILVRDNFFRPPKLGARSPPLHNCSFWGLTREIPHFARSLDETVDACPVNSPRKAPPGRGGVRVFRKGGSSCGIIKQL